MNLSNKLTISRLLSVPVILSLLFTHEHLGLDQTAFRFATSFLADMLFIAATISDYWDGALARRHGWVTNFGRLMDPVADKVLVITLFTALVEMRFFAAWMVAVIVFREFLITGIRLLALQHGAAMTGEGGGKIKAGWQLATIITALSFLWFHDLARLCGADVFVTYLNPHYPSWVWWFLQCVMFVALAYTVGSGWRYVRDNWDLLTATET
jgi:CDP-diacylglycerol--glycerol-3-phosphate 3-phosphatidyltransferase